MNFRPTRKQAPPKKEPKREARTLKGTCQTMLEEMKQKRRDEMVPPRDVEAEEAVMEMIYGPSKPG